jgi:hypothetical protein
VVPGWREWSEKKYLDGKTFAKLPYKFKAIEIPEKYDAV